MILEYRKLGGTGLDVGAIGLGTEYLINLPRETMVAVIHRAIEQRINYFDLFFAQPQFRDTMGAAFKGYRERVILAAHLGSSDNNGQYEMTRDPEICEHFFIDFLTRYHTDYADILFLHNSDSQEDYDNLMKPGGLLEMASRFQQEGKARFIGFSGHNTVTSRQAVESGHIDVLLFPIKSFKWVDKVSGRLFVTIPAVFFASLLLVPDLYIIGVTRSRYGYHTEYGAGYNIFMLWGSIVLIGAIVLLWHKYGRVSRIERKQIGLLVLALLFSTIFYQVFRIPTVDWGVDPSEPYPPLDIWFTVALTFIVLYSMKKYRLFRIQPGASYLTWKTKEPHNLIRSFGSEGNEILYLTRQNPSIVEGRLKDLRERTRIVWITERRKDEEFRV